MKEWLKEKLNKKYGNKGTNETKKKQMGNHGNLPDDVVCDCENLGGGGQTMKLWVKQFRGQTTSIHPEMCLYK